MTTIAAMRVGDKVAIGADSCVTLGNTVMECETKKLYRIGELVFGLAGLAPPVGMIRFLEEAAEGNPDTHYSDDIRGAENLVMELTGFMNAHGHEESEDSIHSIPLQGIIVGQTFGPAIMTPNTSIVVPKDRIAAVGSGMDFALAILYYHRNVSNVWANVWEALKIAAHFDSSTSAPYDIIEMGPVKEDADEIPF